MQRLTVKAKTIVCNLEKYMLERGLNISQLASAIEVVPGTVRGYLQNRFNRIDCEVATKLCTYFGVSFGEMFEIVE